jgi:hypothetical protein
VFGAFLLVDRDFYARINYGHLSPTACAALPDVTARLNIGSTPPSTRPHSKRPHIFGVCFTTDRGGSIVVPLKQSSGTNIFIQN